MMRCSSRFATRALSARVGSASRLFSKPVLAASVATATGSAYLIKRWKPLACEATRATATTAGPHEGEGAKIMVLVGASSKHDLDGSTKELPATVRWGLSGALAIKFATHGFHVVLMSRRAGVLEDMAAEVRKVQSEKGLDTKTLCVSCDLGVDADVAKAFTAIKQEFGIAQDQEETAGGNTFIDCLIFNASPGFPPGFRFGGEAFKPHELDPAFMAMSYDVQVNGCIRCLKQIIPGMLARKQGTILLSGATMQIRGGANFSALAPPKTALRSLGQSMYQCYGPLGIHVCNINIDGVIDSPNTRSWIPPEKMMMCDEIAEQYLAMYRQGRSVWSYELQITPGISAPSVGMRM